MKNTAMRFEGLLDRYFETLLRDTPTYAAVMGIRAAEGKLGRLSLKDEIKHQRQREAALQNLDNLSPRELTNEQQLDRLALRAMLLKENEDFARSRHALEPNAPDQLLNILFHELMRGDDEPARATRNLRALLKQAPDFLDEAATMVRRPEQVWLRVMEQSVAGSAALLQGTEQFLTQHQPQADDAGLIRSAQSALHRYRDKAKAKSPAPAGTPCSACSMSVSR
jgi:hypothetical protein